MSHNPPKFNLRKLLEETRNEVKEVFGKVNKVVVIGVSAGLSAVSAQAALVAPSFDATDSITVGTAVLTGLALIWAIRKAMSLAK
ncbi:MAG: hypothetical protein NTW78_09145 [Campylobacterales bacterium]|nr:hypothetical protein [Campylobacterales bacterium]